MPFKYNPVIASSVQSSSVGSAVNAPSGSITIFSESVAYLTTSVGLFASDYATNRLLVNATGTAVNGNTPPPKAGAIATPTSDTVGTKAAIDAIRVAIQAFGITA